MSPFFAVASLIVYDDSILSLCISLFSVHFSNLKFVARTLPLVSSFWYLLFCNLPLCFSRFSFIPPLLLNHYSELFIFQWLNNFIYFILLFKYDGYKVVGSSLTMYTTIQQCKFPATNFPSLSPSLFVKKRKIKSI